MSLAAIVQIIPRNPIQLSLGQNKQKLQICSLHNVQTYYAGHGGRDLYRDRITFDCYNNKWFDLTFSSVLRKIEKIMAL